MTSGIEDHYFGGMAAVFELLASVDFISE